MSSTRAKSLEWVPPLAVMTRVRWKRRTVLEEEISLTPVPCIPVWVMMPITMPELEVREQARVVSYCDWPIYSCFVVLWLSCYRRGLLIYINSFKCSILSLLLREINGCTLCVILWLLRWNIHQQLQVLHSLITFVGNWRLHIVRHSLITTVAYTTASSASFFDHFCGKLTAA